MDIHPKLAPLLAKHELTPDDFFRRGRLPPDKTHVLERRRALVTELHAAGTSWADMIAITGLSQGSIQRLTGAMWNQASRKNVSEKAAASGRARKGEKKPWLTDQMKQQWAEGKFDFHVGRPRSAEELERQRAAYTPEVRAKMSQKKVLYLRGVAGRGTSYGISERVESLKGGTIVTRSQLEASAIDRLDNDPDVASFVYEPIFVLANGKYIMPDFVVIHADGSGTLIEVKPSFVLRRTDENHPDLRRLKVGAEEAARRGLKFVIWTEKELGKYQRKGPRATAGVLQGRNPPDPVR